MDRSPSPSAVKQLTVPALLDRAAGDAGDRVALIGASQIAGSEVRVTFAELRERALRLAGALAERGVGEGDRVAIMLDQTGAIEAHVAYHASHRLGAINVPVNTRYVKREIEYLLDSSGAKALIVGAEFEAAIQELLPRPALKTILVASAEPRIGEPLDHVIASASPVDRRVATGNADADWIFTSGTTGHPKAVAITHGSSAACGFQAAELWGLDGDGVFLSSAPFFTSTGCHTNLLGALAAQATYVIERNGHFTHALDRIEQLKVTSTFAIPGMIELALERIGEDGVLAHDLSSLKRICYGGQVMPTSFHRRIHSLFVEKAGIELVHLYGLTEGGTSGLKLEPELHAEAAKRGGPGGISVGRSGFNEWIEHRLVDENGEEVGPNTPGEICLRGPALMDRYVDNPEATAAALRDGWLHTGDLGQYDEQGFVYFLNRRKEMIRRGGLNIASSEVESVLVEHPGIEEAAVVPKPNLILEEEVRAFVVLAPGAKLTAAEIVSYCSGRLADYKVPDEVEIIDELPRNAMGRVVKGELTKGFADAAS